MTTHDLEVSLHSQALQGKVIDVIVSGSIGAVESVRFIRALRRLGATVQVCLTRGGALFTTETALAWASARPVIRQFQGLAPHIATGDACVVAPASASFLARLAQGMTDTPASALAASYLGLKKPVLIVPNMHNSLWESPLVQQNIKTLAAFTQILQARQEEGKQKFPEITELADQVAHHINQQKGKRILLTMGTTRGAIDDVRYISNYSSGSLGSHIAEEFYRQGHTIEVVAGPSVIRPRSYSRLLDINSNEEMLEAVQQSVSRGIDGAIFAASVLDFVPAHKNQGKIRSHEELKVDFVATPKIIAAVKSPLKFKVGFKLETEESLGQAATIAEQYLQRYQLSHLVYNQLREVSSRDHKATVYQDAKISLPHELSGKAAIAQYLAHEAERLCHA